MQAKIHHNYQQIGTSSQQTHTSQASMKMWSRVDQENQRRGSDETTKAETVLVAQQKTEVAVKSIWK